MDSSGRKRRGRPASRTIKDGSEKAKKQKLEAKTQRMNKKQEAEAEPEAAAEEQGVVSLPAAGSSFPSMDQLREELSCAICLQICYKPSTTPCGHSFCKTCLESAIVKCGQQCPKCREQFNKGTRSCNVNTVLWNTIQLLFPEEVEARKATVAADDEATRKQEDSIRHRSVHAPVADWNHMPDPEFTDHERQIIRRVIRATNITWRSVEVTVPTSQTYNEDPEVQPRVEALLHAQREELRSARIIYRANLEVRTEGLRAARPSDVTWRNVEVTLRRATQAYDEALESQSWVDARSRAQMNVLFNLPRQRSTL